MTTSPSVRSRYEALVAARTIEADPAQADLVDRLDALAAELSSRPPPRKPGALGRLFGAKEETPPRGLYIYGEVGRGKTMLMDLFYEALAVEKKRRAHFHAYMADVHARLHAWRQAFKRGEVAGTDPIAPVAADLAGDAHVLCFDEFAVTDIADAMILGRLFSAMFAKGVVVVATSNVPPEDLYRNGLNRALFVPFIQLLEERAEVLRLQSRTDFRMEKIGDTPVFFSPADDTARAALDDLFRRLTGGAPATPATLTVLGREVRVPIQALGVARFTFADLCQSPLAAADYLAISRAYHTVVLDGIPRLAPDQRNEARRFILLIDVLYERHLRLLASAAGPPEGLYVADTGAEAFEFARIVSRLHEMGSRDYLAATRTDQLSGHATGLVET